ncbi:MAG TPA: site-specific integrase [Bacteroidia bacterium]|nr:site-specific integrase [Bacteroidia bacterium]
MEYITSIVLDTRREKRKKLYPVKLRIYSTRFQIKKLYTTKYNLSKKDFASIWETEKCRNEHKEIRNELQAIEIRANEICKTLKPFSFSLFEKKYLGNFIGKDTIDSAFSDYTNELRKAGRIGTAVSYECAQSSLKKFFKNAKFTDITPDTLTKYEKWMLNKGNSITTIGIYLRSLRTLFNNVIAEDLLPKEYYPFGKRKYEIPTGSNVKKSLSLNDIALIYYHKANSTEEKSKDYWLFMYLCNGINVKDMCLLKYGNIKGAVLEFERAKTVRTKRNVEPIRVALNKDTLRIIKKWGNAEKNKDNYIFPVLTNELTPERERQLIQQLTQVINCHMKSIAKQLNITNDVTTYAARHSFATILQRSGASTEFISEALGHSNVKTTQNYLAGFEDETKKETTKALTAFKKPISP